MQDGVRRTEAQGASPKCVPDSEFSSPAVLSDGRFKHDLEVLSLLGDLRRTTLPRAQWTHAAHLAVAAALIEEAQGRLPLNEMSALVRAYNEATGLPNTDSQGYHHTITEASLRAVADFLTSIPPGVSLFEKCNRLLASWLADKNWPLLHWSREALFSPEARRSWVPPDLHPLPF
jgi:hypothetical protein